MEQKIQDFINYFKSTWVLDKTKDNKKKSISAILNQFENDGPRTNNHVEGNNAAINRYLKSSNPNFYKVLEYIKVDECNSMWRWYASKNNSSHAESRRKFDIQRDLQFKKYKNQYNISQIDLITFIRSIGYMFDLHENDMNQTNENESDIVKPITDKQMAVDNQLTLFHSFKDLNFDIYLIKNLINSNIELTNSILDKCKLSNPPLYCGQAVDTEVKSIVSKIFSNSNFQTTKIKKDGNCLYRAISMSIFGTEYYHIQLRLAAIRVIIKYESYFRDFANKSNSYEKFDKYGNSINHFQKLVNQVGTMGIFGDEIVMVALSIVINRPIPYINADCNQPIINTLFDPECIIKHEDEEQNGCQKFCVAYTNESQLSINPILITLHSVHYTSIVPTNKDFISNVLKEFEFYNLHPNFILSNNCTV